MKNSENKFPRRKPTKTRLPKAMHKEIIKHFDPDKHEYQYAVHFMSKILQHYMYNKLPFTESMCIPRNYYHKVLSSHKRIWGKLRDNLFNKVRNHSTRHKKASKYIIKPHLVKGEWEEMIYHQSDHQQLQGKINTTNPLYKDVKRVFERTTVSIPQNLDALESIYKEKYIEKIIENNMTYKPRKNWVDNLRVLDLDKTTNQLAKIQLERNLIEVLKFNNSYWRVNRNKTNKRLDTNFTNMTSGFRKNIKINGNTLKQIDLSNSQPCILANMLLYFKEHFLPVLKQHHQSNDNREILKDIPDEIIYHPLCKGYDCIQIPTSNGRHLFKRGNLNNINPIFLYLMMWGFRDLNGLNGFFNSNSFDLFCGHSLRGTLYEYIRDNLLLSSRKDAKNSTYKFLFGYTQDKNYKEIFPSVSKLIIDFKVWLHDIEKGCYESDPDTYLEDHGRFMNKSGKNKFSVLLQRIESEIVIDRIYVDLVEEYDCLTVHDSFLYYQDEVPEIVKERLAKCLPYGFKCVVT